MAGAIALAVVLLVGGVRRLATHLMRLPFAVDSLACAPVAIMLIPSYTAAALTGEMVWTIPDAGRRKRLGREPEAARGPDKGSGRG